MDLRPAPVYHQCLQQALGLARDWIPAWLSQLQAALHQREAAAGSAHEKQVLTQSRASLARHRDLIASRFLEQLAHALDGSDACARPTGPRSLQNLSFDELELMDDRQVHDTVEQARVQQLVKLSADDELYALSARMSRAQGLTVVRHEANPLRPEVVVDALMQALRSLHLDESVRNRWLHLGAVALGDLLKTYYRTLSGWLDAQGVEPAGYSVVQAPVARAMRTNGVGAVHAGTAVRTVLSQPGPVAAVDSVPAAALIGRDAVLTLDHLHQLLVGNLAQSGHLVSDHGSSGSGNAMVRTLAAEVVTLLLRRMAEDTRLMPPVREMVDSLKPALLQLARTDPRFFADRQNPARRLLDSIAERALAFTSEQDAGFAEFAQRVHAVVQALQAPGPNTADRFATQLQRLSELPPASNPPSRGLAVQTLVKVEQRKLLAQRVVQEIEARNDFARAPGVVRRFLTGPWAQVVAQARLDATALTSALPSDAPALRYMELLPDLLWSSQLVLASRNRPRLIKVIPHLLRTLREGLDSIDYPRAQAEAFFQALMGLHEAAYKTQHAETGMVDFAPSQQAPDSDAMWMQPEEARDSGFIDDLVIETQPAFLDTQPQHRDWADLQAEQALQRGEWLPVGTWVDLLENESALRCQLTWASPHGTMFLFNCASGRSVSLTRRGLERLQARGRIQVVADHGLVDDALDAVTRQAIQNSAQG